MRQHQLWRKRSYHDASGFGRLGTDFPIEVYFHEQLRQVRKGERLAQIVVNPTSRVHTSRGRETMLVRHPGVAYVDRTDRAFRLWGATPARSARGTRSLSGKKKM